MLQKFKKSKKEMRGNFGGDEYVCGDGWMGTCIYLIYPTVHIKYVQFFIYQLYLNKVVNKKIKEKYKQVTERKKKCWLLQKKKQESIFYVWVIWVSL